MNNFVPTLHNITDSVEWHKYLDDNGYVVIKNILSDHEKQDIFETFKKDLNTVSPNIHLDVPSSLIINNTPIMFAKGMGIFNGFGQSDFMWKLRLNENIQSIFKSVHNTDDICVSLDGFSLFVSSKQKSKPWMHVDQNSKNPIYSIQGAYNFKPVNKDDAGFILVPGSHTSVTETTHNKDWIVFDNQEIYLNKSVKLIIPENCFILWNSKLIHSNTGLNVKKNEFNRLTAYITFLPKNLRSDDTLKNKIQAYIQGKTTSHWANKCEVKQYPWGFKSTYEKRGYNTIKPTMIENKIPDDRLNLL